MEKRGGLRRAEKLTFDKLSELKRKRESGVMFQKESWDKEEIKDINLNKDEKIMLWMHSVVAKEGERMRNGKGTEVR